MKTILARIAAGLSMASLSMVAHAQANPPAQMPNPPSNRLEPLPAVQFQSDSNVFQTFGSGSPTFQQQAERFRDPQQRAQVRAEQREQILISHQGIGELLQLDAATENKLVELLADLQTDDLEHFYVSAAARSSQGNPWEPLMERAKRETAKVQALRDLLGQEKLERYQTFAGYVNERNQVAKLDERLSTPHKLSVAQKERLVELYREQARSEIDRSRLSRHPHSPFGPSTRTMPSPGELQRRSQLMTIAANEENWRRAPKADEQMRKRAAAFLTPAQLSTLAQMQAEKADQQRQWIENARIQAGLNREIPEQSEEAAPQVPPLLDGEIKVAVKLTVNGGEATHFTHTGRNGEAVTFRCPEGLFVEVRPTVYVNDAFDVRVSYYEETSKGERRRIGEGGQMGTITRTSSGAVSGGGGGMGGSVVTGNQGYAVQLSTQVEPA